MKLLLGNDVSESISKDIELRIEKLSKIGVKPTLATVRVGENPSDIAYEKGATNRGAKVGVDIKNIVLDQATSTEQLLDVIQNLNNDEDIHGILIFRPLPAQIDDIKIRNAIKVTKDVDGISDLAMAGVYSDDERAFAPCTAEACIKILKYYGYEIKGKNVVVLGRSLVIGKPVSMLLLKEDATVTICHSKTLGLDEVCKRADIIISAVGKIGAVKQNMIKEGQVLIDVGINVDEQGNLKGDIDFENIKDIVEGITPVPKGVGSVTSTILMEHVVRSAERG